MKHFLASVVFFWLSGVHAQLPLVSSATPEATEAGVSIFDQGGNAVDAAVAIAFTLGVTEPAMSGLGGRTMFMLSLPGKTPIAIGGHALTPALVDQTITKSRLDYYKQAAIPSTVKVLSYVFKKYGSGKVTWQEVLAPAIKYAGEGFVMGPHRHHVFKRWASRFKDSPFHNRELLVFDQIPAIGDLVKQPSLANTLKQLALKGGNEFYSGEMARTIAEDFKANGGWISYGDLAHFPEPEEHTPLHTTYRGYDVYSFVPPSGGWQVLQTLNMLERFEPEPMSAYSQKRNEAVIQALNLSHNSRLSDPITDYSAFTEQVNTKISKAYAREILDKGSAHLKSDSDHALPAKGQGETTHFSVVDKAGVAVSVTSSLGAYFGAMAATDSLGFFYNSYLKSLLGFGLGKSLQPRTKIPSSMSPSLVKKEGKNVLVIGTPGSKRIVSTIAQLIQLWVDSDIDIKTLLSYPRIHAINGKVFLEDEHLDHDWLMALRKRGYEIDFPDYDLTKHGKNAYFGGVHAIEFKNNVWQAAADPRRDGQTND